MTAYEQRSYPGAAADTLLNADITSGALTFSVSPGTGNNYPDGSGGPFFVAIDYDVSKSEKIRVTSRINDTFTIATVVDRGYDGTTAQAHTAGAKVRAVWTATDAQEANRAAANTVGQVTAKGDLIAGTAANALGKVAAGPNGAVPIYDDTRPTGVRAGTNPTLVGASLDVTSTHGGISGTTLANDHAAWTTYTPTFTNVTGGMGSFAYKLIGKSLKIRGYFTGGSYTADGLVAVSLPGVTSVVGVAMVVPGIGVGNWAVSSGGTTVAAQTPNTGGTPLAGAYFNGEIEIV